MTKIYHNPRCSKSRLAIELLERLGLDCEIVKYLEDPPSKKELTEIVAMLKISPEQLVRKKEKLFRELELGNQTLSDDQWLEVLAEHPKLIERPIVVHNGRAAIGRPTEKIAEILD